MAAYKASMCLATSNNFVLPGAASNDFLVYTGNPAQSTLFGVSNVGVFMRVDGTGNVAFAGNVGFSNQVALSGVQLTQRTSTTTNNVTAAVTAVNGFSKTAGNVTISMDSGSNYIALSRSNVELARINSNGWLGLGRSRAQSVLHLVAPGTPLTVDGSNNAAYIALSNSSNGSVHIGLSYAVGNFSTSAGSNDLVVRNNFAGGKVHLQNGASAALTVNSNNYVGIGTATPCNVLHVIGNVQVSGAVYNNYGTLNIPNGTAAGWYRIASAGSGIGKITLQVASVGKQEFCTFVHGQTWIDSSFIKVESFVGRNGSPQNITQIRYLVNQSSGASYIDAYLANSFFSTFALTLSATVVDNSASTALVLAPTAAAVDAGYTQAVLTNVQVNAISYNSANAMTITSGGYVGIGTSSPAKPLEVFAGTSGAGYLDAAMFTQNIAGPNDGMSQGPAIVFKVINNNNASWNEGRIRTVASPALGGQLIFETASQNASDTTEKMRLTHSGWLGIGTTGPVAPLHVAGTGGTNYSGNYFTSSGSLANGNSPGNLSSIYATNWITSANGFIASSDARIKNVLTPSSLESDLDLIDSIDVVRFDYIDKVSYPDSKIGFIAQQVQQRLPSAVKRSANYIPNVYKFAEAKNNAITFEGRIENIAASDKLRVITCENVGVETSVISVGNDSVTVKETIEDGRVFVYGTQVDDFLSVDYDMMSSLAFSGVQQLNRIVKRLESRIARIEERLALQ